MIEPLESRVMLSRVTGIDVSNYQGTINWTQVRSAGEEFAFAKATEGTTFADSTLAANMTGAASAGVLMGAYHFAHPDSSANDAVNEADWFLSNAEQYIAAGRLRPVLDLEDGASLGPTALSQWVNTFCSTVKTATDVDPIIYCNTDYATNDLDSSVAGHSLWIANWNTGYGDPLTTGSPPDGVWGADNWNFWQYSDSGTVTGVSGNVDLDVYAGDLASLESSFLIGGASFTNYDNNFENGAGSEWSKNTISTTPSGRKFLGQFGGGNNGTLTGAASWIAGRAGRGSAIQLDGSSGWVDIEPDETLSFSTGAVTISAWVNLSSTSGTPVIAENVPRTGGSGFLLGLSGGKLVLEIHSPTNQIYSNASASGGTVLSTGAWHQVTGTFANGTITTYVDGVQDRQASVGINTLGVGGTLVLGKRKGSTTRFLHGALDDVQVFSRALSSSEVVALPAAGGSDGLIASYDFDENSGTRIHDSANAAGVKLTLPDLPSHTQLTLSFDLYVIHTWDGRSTGAYGPDIWTLTADGQTLLNTTFANGNVSGQSYPGSYPTGDYPKQTGASEINTLGYGAPSDSVYHLTYVINHTADSVVFNFTASDLQDIGDESWGIDNVSVTMPGPSVSGAASIQAGSPYTLSLNATGMHPSRTSWSVDWGDGTPPQHVSGTRTTANHTYEVGVGNYVIAASATDDARTLNANAVTVNVTPRPQSPYGGTAWPVPGLIENENFDVGGEGVAYHDVDHGNTGGYYRNSEDVDVDVARDNNGSYVIGWAKATEWLEYTVNVQTTGTYDFATYLSSPGDGGQFHWEVDGNNVTGTMNVPNTSGYYNYQPVTVAGVNLSVGQHLLRLALDTGGSNGLGWTSVANFNYFTLTDPSAPLSAPTNLNAAATFPTRVDLSWADSNINETAFKLERSPDGTSNWTQVALLRANTAAYADTGLTPGASYAYRLRATNASVDSPYSNVTGVVTTPLAVAYPIKINFQVDNTPAVPGYKLDSGDLYGDRGDGLSYGWSVDDRSQDRERGINPDRRLDTLVHIKAGSNWQITVPNGNYDVTVSIGDAQYPSEHTINVNGVNYWSALDLASDEFRSKTVTITVADGRLVIDEGPAGDRATRINYVVIAQTSDTNTPSTPTGLSASVGGPTQINLDWADNPEAGVTYNVYRGTTADFTTDASSLLAGNLTNSEYLDQSLPTPGIYYYKVTALRAGTESAPATINADSSQTPVVPAAPSNLMASPASATAIGLDWTDNSTNEQTFKIERSENGQSGWTEIKEVSANVTSYTDIGLDPETRYFYRVRAHNSAGDSTYTNTADATTGVVGNGLHFDTPSTAEIDLDWTDGSDPGVLTFNIYRGTTADFVPSSDNLIALGLNTSSFEDVDLNAASTYYYKVDAVADDGNELGLIGTAGITTLATDTALPSAPTDLTSFSPNDTEITLRWKDTSANETSFVIQESPDGLTGWTTMGTTEANGEGYTVDNLDPDTDYSYRVLASNTAGSSTTTAPTTTSTRPSTADYFVMVVGGHFQTQAYLDAGNSVGAIADLLRQNSGGLNLEVHTYAEYVTQKQHDAGIQPRIGTLGTGQAYADFERAFSNGMRKWAIIGYSHGGGITYQFADRINTENPQVNPARLGFSGYIDAIQRRNSDDLAPSFIFAETRRPPGSLYHYNMWELNGTWGLHGQSMRQPAADIDVHKVYKDDGNPITHSSIVEQPSVQQTFRDQTVAKLQQMV